MKRFDEPMESRSRRFAFFRPDPDFAGVWAERIARFSGTPKFLIYLTIFVAVWLGWNTYAPESVQFDSAALGFTALTLMLSLQASYAAPLILLAQNRQDDRDRVVAENDRQTAERNLQDTEFLTREIASLRLAINELATRDFVRSEIRDQLEETMELIDPVRDDREELRSLIEEKDREIAALRAKLGE
ncbi:DUF1003 domain-containing protein [Arcanobacterium canis]|uniref:DUF1003 domain-containing protein n=1 Tax=Arcanobacterium canis TaxID=999183 RepID=A0ABY8FZB7_9ACTO|nr:DUF1003 domain-containing protein [Arcanobacterium canis]WFM83873.1 DUF1003 domain-containing protein [Arcanobacterium canis]